MAADVDSTLAAYGNGMAAHGYAWGIIEVFLFDGFVRIHLHSGDRYNIDVDSISHPDVGAIEFDDMLEFYDMNGFLRIDGSVIDATNVDKLVVERWGPCLKVLLNRIPEHRAPQGWILTSGYNADVSWHHGDA